MRVLPPGALVTRQLRGALHHLTAFFVVAEPDFQAHSGTEQSEDQKFPNTFHALPEWRFWTGIYIGTGVRR